MAIKNGVDPNFFINQRACLFQKDRDPFRDCEPRSSGCSSDANESAGRSNGKSSQAQRSCSNLLIFAREARGNSPSRPQTQQSSGVQLITRLDLKRAGRISEKSCFREILSYHERVTASWWSTDRASLPRVRVVCGFGAKYSRAGRRDVEIARLSCFSLENGRSIYHSSPRSSPLFLLLLIHLLVATCREIRTSENGLTILKIEGFGYASAQGRRLSSRIFTSSRGSINFVFKVFKDKRALISRI